MKKSKIPDTTIETLTRNFFKESRDYGFQYEDYLKYVNVLLDHAINAKGKNPDQKELNRTNTKNVAVKTTELPIETKNIIIRDFKKAADIELIEEWQKDMFGRYFMLSMTNSQDGKIDKLTNTNYNKLGIITLKNNLPIGIVAFLNIDKVYQKAELRKLIGVPEHRAHGYGKEATRYWIKYGFQKLNLKKIYLNTIDTNIHNIKINEEMGFKVEGILRNEALVDGVVHDVLRMGLLVEDCP
jgi:diamine N-acetyltransferase